VKIVDDHALDQSRELRSAFGCFPTGIAVATCTGVSGRPAAVTINSFCSVSLVPPLVSFALGQTARCLASFLTAPRFAIHVLKFDQLMVATRFARPAVALWDGIDHHTTSSGHIILDQCAAVFLCDRLDVRDMGDHSVIVGRVNQFSWDPNASPLAFCHGRYGSLELNSSYDETERPWGQLAWG
jgi:flavin reductase (DIM6/NTAB) family NADH-FMN oxidoreductase RutF